MRYLAYRIISEPDMLRNQCEESITYHHNSLAQFCILKPKTRLSAWEISVESWRQRLLDAARILYVLDNPEIDYTVIDGHVILNENEEMIVRLKYL